MCFMLLNFINQTALQQAAMAAGGAPTPFCYSSSSVQSSYDYNHQYNNYMVGLWYCFYSCLILESKNWH